MSNGIAPALNLEKHSKNLKQKHVKRNGPLDWNRERQRQRNGAFSFIGMFLHGERNPHKLNIKIMQIRLVAQDFSVHRFHSMIFYCLFGRQQNIINMMHTLYNVISGRLSWLLFNYFIITYLALTKYWRKRCLYILYIWDSVGQWNMWHLVVKKDGFLSVDCVHEFPLFSFWS